MLDAALDLFVEHGFEGTSLQDIAAQLGVTKAAVYYHFHSKDDLLTALVQPAFDELSRFIDGREARPHRGVRRTAELTEYVDFLLRNRRVMAFITRDAAAMSRPVVVAQGVALRDRVEALLLGHAEDDRLARFWVSGTMQAMAGALLSCPDAPEEWLREELVEVGSHVLAGYRKATRRRGAASGGTCAGPA